MSTTTTKPTAASQVEALKAELARKTAEAEQVKAALAQQAAEDAQIRAINEGLAKEAAANRERVTALEAEVEKLRAESAAASAVPAADESSAVDDSVWVVALPAPGVTVPDLVYGGKPVERRKDTDGFAFFKVSRAQAASLLGSRSGMKYALAGPVTLNKLEITRRNGDYTEKVTVYRHVKAQYPTGGAFWQPIIEEESGDGNA
jgi:hypothetical protein